MLPSLRKEPCPNAAAGRRGHFGSLWPHSVPFVYTQDECCGFSTTARKGQPEVVPRQRKDRKSLVLKKLCLPTACVSSSRLSYLHRFWG